MSQSQGIVFDIRRAGKIPFGNSSCFCVSDFRTIRFYPQTGSHGPLVETRPGMNIVPIDIRRGRQGIKNKESFPAFGIHTGIEGCISTHKTTERKALFGVCSVSSPLILAVGHKWL